MATTVEATIKGALRKLGVIDAQQPLKPLDASTGILVLNDMMNAYEALGLSMGWQNVANPGDDMPTPPELNQAIQYSLAIKLAPEYEVEPSAAVGIGAVQGEALMSQQVLANTYVRTSYDDLPVGTGQGDGYGLPGFLRGF